MGECRFAWLICARLIFHTCLTPHSVHATTHFLFRAGLAVTGFRRLFPCAAAAADSEFPAKKCLGAKHLSHPVPVVSPPPGLARHLLQTMSLPDALPSPPARSVQGFRPPQPAER
jgi:hypothetical protein